jgi:hypothetical protein
MVVRQRPPQTAVSPIGCTAPEARRDGSQAVTAADGCSPIGCTAPEARRDGSQGQAHSAQPLDH